MAICDYHIYNDQASSIFHIQRKTQAKHYGIEVTLYASIHDFNMYEHAFMYEPWDPSVWTIYMHMINFHMLHTYQLECFQWVYQSYENKSCCIQID